MTAKLGQINKSLRQLLRYVTIGAFPAAMLLSVPYPVVTRRGGWYYSRPTVAPAVGVIFLFTGLVLAVVDTKMLKKFKDQIRGTQYEYRIVLPTAQKDRDASKKNNSWIVFT